MMVISYFLPLFKEILLFQAHHYRFYSYLLLLRSNNSMFVDFDNNFYFLKKYDKHKAQPIRNFLKQSTKL